MNILPKLEALRPALTQIRRDLHAYPELAFGEQRTSDVVARELTSYGVEVHRGLAGTGVVGTLRCGSGFRSIGLRADMDALPIQETNTFEHRSRHDGKMHACGHDGHTAMLLGAARHLAESLNFDGTVHFIFQPAEEHDGGGRVMVEQGLFEKFPMDAVYGLHNWPGLDLGRFALIPGPMMASADQFDIVVRGHGAHAAMPHLGVDPVVAGSAIVQALQTLVSRSIEPVDAAVISVTQFHAGDAYNVIPTEALLRGTVRTFKPETRDAMEAGMRRICENTAAAYGARAEFTYKRGYPPLINWPEQTEISARVLEAMVGTDHVHRQFPPTMGAEDFAYMLQAKPGCYVFMGNGQGAGTPGCMLHNPGYDFNDAALPIGASYWVRLVEHCLPKNA
ncbi:MAG: amidohydrolase [Betaproteobacteria bacterium]|nr:amidohydrolase [Betaproteobacteria bacterium]